MWREEGFRGFMRGNGINCLRIVPYSAVQFTTYEQLKKVSSHFSPFASTDLPISPNGFLQVIGRHVKSYFVPLAFDSLSVNVLMFNTLQWFTNNGERQLDTPTRLMSGALAGITSVCESSNETTSTSKVITVSPIRFDLSTGSRAIASFHRNCYNHPPHRVSSTPFSNTESANPDIGISYVLRSDARVVDRSHRPTKTVDVGDDTKGHA